MRFKILIAGSSQTRLFKKVCAKFEDLPYSLLTLENAFASDLEAEEYWRENSPSVVIFQPNLNGVADGESHIILEQAARLAHLSATHNIPFICLSSHKVLPELEADNAVDESFDFEGLGAETNLYWRLESAVQVVAAHVILRAGWIVDEFDDGLLDQLLPRVISGDSALVPSEKNFGNPVYVTAVADVLITVVQQILCGAENWGVYHVHGADTCSEAELVDHLVRVLQSDFKQDVIMPEVANVDDERHIFDGQANLSGVKLTEDFGVQLTSWRSGFKYAVSKWLDRHGVVEIKKGA